MSYFLLDAHGRQFPIGSLLRLGSHPTNQVVLPDPQVSPYHATLWEQSGILYVRDENSQNGSFVNGAQVREAALRPGDRLQIGSYVFTILQTAASPQAFIPQPNPPYASQPVYASNPPPAQKKGPGCGCWFLAGCVIFLFLCILTAGAGYLALRNGWITQNGLLNLVGLGPGYVEVDNFRDDAIQVAIQQLDAKSGDSPAQGGFSLNAFDLQSYTAPQAGRYQVDFGSPGGGADLGSCTLNIRAGDRYQFVTLPDKIVINLVNSPPTLGSDLVVGTSRLCR